MSVERVKKFNSLKTHAHYKKLYVQLNDIQISRCIDFIFKHAQLNKNEFEMAVNRIYLNKDMSKYNKTAKKRMLIMQELLAASNV